MAVLQNEHQQHGEESEHDQMSSQEGLLDGPLKNDPPNLQKTKILSI